MQQQELANEIQKLVDKVAKVKTKQSRAQGRLDSEMANLAKLGFGDLEQAFAFKDKEQQRVDSVLAELNDTVEEFKDVYGTFLEEASR